MSPRSLFNLILKILGIFFIRNLLDAVSRSFSVLVYFSQYTTHKEAWFNFGVTIPPLFVLLLSIWLLIFKTESVIDWLKLDKHHASEIIGMKVHHSVVLSIAVIAAGGWIILNEVPELLRQIGYYLQERKLYVRMARPDMSSMLMSAVRLFLGFVVVLFNNAIVNSIEVKRRRKQNWYWPLRLPFQKKVKV